MEAELGRDCRWRAISTDASARRYYRVFESAASPAPATWIAVDAPPDSQQNERFVDIARRAASAGLNVPSVRTVDFENGFLLLEDLGDWRFLDACTAGGRYYIDGLFDAAIDALVVWQSSLASDGLGVLDRSALHTELQLFTAWYVERHLGIQLDHAEIAAVERAYAAILDRLARQCHVLVHRDYTLRNLMVADPAPGIIDFQDARAGPIAYDVASLCRDAFVSWPDAQVVDWQQRYWRRARAAGLPVAASLDEFSDDLAWVELQRHLKVLGVFARLYWRDGKPGYIEDAPRFIDYLRPMIETQPALAGLRPVLRCAP